MIESLMHLLEVGGLFIIFLLVLTEGNPLIGSFVPGQIIVIIYGVLLATHGADVNLYLTVFVVFLGAFLGDLLGFYMGRKCGGKKLQKFGLHPESSLYKTSCLFFKKFGPMSLVLGREFNLTRAFIPFFAGVSKMKYSTFYFYSFISCFLWSVISILLGFYFGFLVLDKLEFIFTFILFLIVYLVFVYFVYSFFKKLYLQNSNFLRKHALVNVFNLVILFLSFSVFLSLKLFDLDILLNSSLDFLLFNFFDSFAFLFSNIFLMLLYEALFLSTLFLKKVKLFVTFLWGGFLYFQFVLLIIFLVRKFFGEKLLFSVMIYVLFFYFFYLLVRRVTFLNNYFKKLVLFGVFSLIFLLLVKSHLIGGNFYSCFLSFIVGAIGCEFLYILSHYEIIDSYLKDSADI